MNLITIRPKTDIEEILLSITKICETLIEQTPRKAEETLNIRLKKSRQTLHFNPPIAIEVSWMIGLTSLEVYNSIFNQITTNNKLEFFTESSDECSFTELKDELEAIFNFSIMTSEHLHDDIKGPRLISTYKKLETENKQTDG